MSPQRAAWHSALSPARQQSHASRHNRASSRRFLERRDSVISTCASSGPTWRISTGWLMLGLFNISKFTFCKLSFSSRSAYLPTHTVTISSCSRPRYLAILAFLTQWVSEQPVLWIESPTQSLPVKTIMLRKISADTTLCVKIVPKIGKNRLR